MPAPGGRVVAAHLAGVPLADPDPAPGVRPHPARSLIAGGWLDHGGRAALDVHARDVAAGQGGVVDVAGRGGGDPVRPTAARGVPHLHVPGGGVEAPVDAVLTGEPEASAAIEGRGVEVDVAARSGQRPVLDLARARIDPHDGVRPALGDPGGAVRADDHPVRGGGRAKGDEIDLAAGRVEPPQVPAPLSGVPDDAVGPDRHVVWPAPGRQRVGLHLDPGRGRRGQDEQRERDREQPVPHGQPPR